MPCHHHPRFFKYQPLFFHVKDPEEGIYLLVHDDDIDGGGGGGGGGGG